MANKTIKDIVIENADALKAMTTHTELREWAISQGFNNRSAFPKFKLALNEIGLDYDVIKTGIKKQKSEELKAKINYELTLYSDAKASAGRYGITDKDGNVVWYGRFFENDNASEQSSAELEAAKKAVWFASKVKEALNEPAIKLTLYVDAEWLTYQDHSGQKGYALTTLASKYDIQLEVLWISGKKNPADKWTVASGFKKWQDNDLKSLADYIKDIDIPESDNELEIKEQDEDKTPSDVIENNTNNNMENNINESKDNTNAIAEIHKLFEGKIKPSEYIKKQEQEKTEIEKETEAKKETINNESKETTEDKLSKSKQYEINIQIENIVNEKGDDRSKYTTEEIELIKKYSGHGGLGNFYGKNGIIETNIEYNQGFLYEFYTNDIIVKKMWALAYKYGYSPNNSSVLEPSCGIGRFLKYVPKGTTVWGYEFTNISSKIAKILYPFAKIYYDTFESMFLNAGRFTNMPKKYFDLVIGNPPYGSYVSKYSDIEKNNTFAKTWEQYFIMRGIDCLKSNGLLIYIIPSTFMNNNNSYNEFKEELSKKAVLLDAYRLPTKSFDFTEINTDIIVLQKI